MIVTPETKKNIIGWIIAVLVPVVVIIPVYLCTNFGMSNICAIIGVIYLAYVSLMWVTRLGTFDVFRYQFLRWIDSFKKGSPKRYEDAYTYKEAMKEKRRESTPVWIPFLSVGTVLVVLSIIFAYNPV